jgi:hypothetical protein
VYSGRYAGCSRLASSGLRFSFEGVAAGAGFRMTRADLSAVLTPSVRVFALVAGAPDVVSVDASAPGEPIPAGAVREVSVRDSCDWRTGSACEERFCTEASADVPAVAALLPGGPSSAGPFCCMEGDAPCASVETFPSGVPETFVRANR